MEKMDNICHIIIKNMVCRRCIIVVEQLLADEGIQPINIDLGMVTLSQPLSPDKHNLLSQRLSDLGFELIENKRLKMIERIKAAVIEFIRDDTNAESKLVISRYPQLSDYLQFICGREYSTLSKTFSEIRGETIEHYAKEQRIERVKELLFYDELTISEISFRLGYSSAAHLSTQFKNSTGMTPTQFKTLKSISLRGIDRI